VATNYLASDIIYAGYRLCGALRGPQRGLSDSEMADGLDALNALVDSWNIDPLTIWANQDLTLPLIQNQITTTIGIDPTGVLTADYNYPRPDKITNANIITQVNSGQPVRTPLALLTTDGWANIQVQQTASQIPQALYDDYAYPLSNLSLWPYPNGPGSLELFVWQSISQFASPSDNFLCPPGYRRALEFNLAVELHPRYPQFAMDPMVAMVAREAKADVEAHNSVLPVMSCDPALLSAKKSSWNYLDGNFTSNTGQSN
jgi:hypothetical protein